MLTRNAGRIFSDNVTRFEQTKAVRIGVICQGASSAPQVLLARLQEHSFQFVFHLVFPAYTVQLPSISALPTAFKKLCSNIRGSGLPDLFAVGTLAGGKFVWNKLAFVQHVG